MNFTLPSRQKTADAAHGENQSPTPVFPPTIDSLELYRSGSPCSACSSLNWGYMWDWGHLDSRYRPSRTLKPNVDNLSSTKCPLCRFFEAIWDSQSSGERNYVEELRKHGSVSVRTWPLDREFFKTRLFKMYLAISTVHSLDRKVRFGRTKATLPSDKIGIRRRGKYFDFGIAQSWLEHCCFCHDEHGCCRKPEGALSPFCVLDCETKKVITAPLDCCYVALSYVWGTQAHEDSKSSTDSQSVMQDPNSVMHFQFDYQNAPRVVKDAIGVALKLGIPYLWVDRYCIDQADSLLKDAQIRQMDLIYRNAHFTIVAAAGEDATRGLPGTSGTPRTPIPSIKINHEILQTVSLGPERILGSKWASRGWTFQEALLSTRHIVFTEHEVFFQCSGMRCSESLQIPLDLLHHHEIHESDGFNLSVAVTPRIGSNPSTFHTYISDFSKRTLARETDTLNASRASSVDLKKNVNYTRTTGFRSTHVQPRRERVCAPFKAGFYTASYGHAPSLVQEFSVFQAGPGRDGMVDMFARTGLQVLALTALMMN